MKKNKIAALLLMTVYLTVCIAPISLASPAAGSASLDNSGYLRYQAKTLSWNGDEITISGCFANVSKDKDVYDMSGASFVINDADGNPAISTTLNSGDLKEVRLGPGEIWDYSVVRTISGFNPETYNVMTFSTSVSCEFSIRDHESNCSYCSSRDNPTFKTEDTMSEEQWQQLLAKLRTEVNGGSSDQSNSGQPDQVQIPYTPIQIPERTVRNCTKCGGSGKRICEHCEGVGYKQRREQRTCLVAHHVGCNKYPNLGVCRPSCHEADYYWTKDKCTWCNGTGMESCTLCRGVGTLNY